MNIIVNGEGGSTGGGGGTGPQGPPGPAIKGTVPTSANLPPTGNSPGDTWITVDTGHMWIWNPSAWTDAGPFVGPAGAKGDKGDPGNQGIQGIQGVQGNQGNQGIQGIQGIPGNDGATGQPGGSSSYFNYRCDTTTIAATDPGAGRLRWNNANQTLATFLHIDWLTTDGFDAHGLFKLTGPPAHIVIQDKDLAVNQQTFVMTGLAVQNTDWFSVPVAFVSANPPGFNFSNSPHISVLLINQGLQGVQGDPGAQGPKGDKGDQGIQGIQGVQGNPGAAGTNGTNGADGVTRPFRLSHTWGLTGDVSALTTLPSIFIPIRSGQAASLLSIRMKIASGTSVVAQVKKNGTNVGTGISVNTTATTTSLGPTSLADNDEISVTLSSPVGTPSTLSATIIIEQTP